MDELINVKVGVVITEADIEDIMLVALDGVEHWADEVQVVGKYRGDDVCEHLANKGWVSFHLKEGPIEEGGPEWYDMNWKMFIKGIRRYLNTTDNPIDILYYNGVRMELDLGMCDAEVADLMVQYALFGEQVFA